MARHAAGAVFEPQPLNEIGPEAGRMWPRVWQDGTRLDRNQDQQERMEQRLAQTQKRLEAQYTALDAKIGSLSGLSSFVSQQIALWNKA